MAELNTRQAAVEEARRVAAELEELKALIPGSRRTESISDDVKFDYTEEIPT